MVTYSVFKVGLNVTSTADGSETIVYSHIFCCPMNINDANHPHGINPVIICDLKIDSGGMIAYDACPRTNVRSSNAECCVGSIIGTGCYLSESLPVIHHKDQSFNSRCLLQARNETTHFTVGAPLKNRMHVHLLGQKWLSTWKLIEKARVL